MQYVIFAMLLFITTMVAMSRQDLDLTLLLLIIDIFYIFLL